MWLYAFGVAGRTQRDFPVLNQNVFFAARNV
jgi:hypothetical protein